MVPIQISTNWHHLTPSIAPFEQVVRWSKSYLRVLKRCPLRWLPKRRSLQKILCQTCGVRRIEFDVYICIQDHTSINYRVFHEFPETWDLGYWNMKSFRRFMISTVSICIVALLLYCFGMFPTQKSWRLEKGYKEHMVRINRLPRYGPFPKNLSVNFRWGCVAKYANVAGGFAWVTGCYLRRDCHPEM